MEMGMAELCEVSFWMQKVMLQLEHILGNTKPKQSLDDRALAKLVVQTFQVDKNKPNIISNLT